MTAYADLEKLSIAAKNGVVYSMRWIATSSSPLSNSSRSSSLEAGHYAWEEAPDGDARLLVDWIGGGYSTPAK
jgi:hypothetical protein